MPPGVISIIALAAILTAGFVSLSRIIVENRTRRYFVDRGLSAEEIRLLVNRPVPMGYDSLRIALFLVPVGAALMIAQYLPFGTRDPFTYGLVILAGGLGFFAYALVLVSIRRRRGGQSHERRD